MSNYFKRERIAWIHETLRIFGYINRVHIERKFGVSTPQASCDIGDAIASDNRIVYDKSLKRFYLLDAV